jgi:type VI secretion system protein ImpL
MDFFNEPGRFGLEKMINSAQRKRLDGDVFELRWPQGTVSVGVQLRIISNAATATAAQSAATSVGSGGGAAFKPGVLPAIIAGPEDSAQAPTQVSANPVGDAS